MADYNLEGARWGAENPSVTWSIAQQNYPDRNFQFSSFMSSDFLNDIRNAFARWFSVANINFVEVPDSDTSDIRFGFNSIDGHYNIAGITQYNGFYGSDGIIKIDSADIEIDSDEGWHLAGSQEVDASNYNHLYPILLHEIGHAIGLAHYSGAPAIMNPSNSVPDLTGSDIDGVQAIYGPPGTVSGGDGGNNGYTETYRDNGTRLVDISAPDLVLASVSADIFLNHRTSGTTFVFDPGFGHDIIGGFVPGGDGHDTIDLPSSDFSGLADVLRHTQNAVGGAVIHDPTSGDTIRLNGLSRTALIKNKNLDFAFHG